MPEVDEIDWDAVGLVKSSQYRQAAVSYLTDAPATPSEIAEDTGQDIAHISRALQDLREVGVVDLLVSEDRMKGRYYGLTTKGENVAIAHDRGLEGSA